MISLVVVLSPAAALGGQGRPLDVRVDSGEAVAVLRILEKRAAGQVVSDADWAVLFESEGYRRLTAREHSLRREFTDSAFRAFVLSESLLARRGVLAETLRKWERADVNASAEKALRYLPPGSRIRATIYPVIKPQDNSFVFETTTNPAIFLSLDPAMSESKFANTFTHELHHIGIANACTDSPEPDAAKMMARRWLGALSEGIAMLAAAGSADTHPHATSEPADRERWDRDVANVTRDLPELEAFFTAILNGDITGDAITQRGLTYFGVQGPWYTVGWVVASTIERRKGPQRLVALICDLPAMLHEYNETADRGMPRWSESLVRRLARRP